MESDEAIMTKEDLRKFLEKHSFSQQFGGAIVGRDARQVRYWLSGTHKIPMPVALIYMAYDQGQLEPRWLAKTIQKLNPKAAALMGHKKQ